MFNIWPKMATKRKFNMVDLSDEEGSSEKINGVSLFNKYKNKTPTKTNPDKVAPNVVKEKTLNETSRVPTEEPGPSHENVDSQKVNKKQIGKTFAQTFAFLKDTDLYELPPKPTIPEKVIPKNSNAIIVNSKQRGNPILKYVRNIPWEYGNIVPDYEVGQTSCILFLSLRYHNLNPDYIHERLKQLGSKYTLRVLLVQVDVQNTKHSLKELGKIAILADCTLILAWSPEEAGRYLETYKAYEHKPPDVLQERVEADYIAKMQDVLTTIKSINRTDVITLLSTFGSLKKIVNANKDEIGLCPGFGPQKDFIQPRSQSLLPFLILFAVTLKLKKATGPGNEAQRLYKVLNESFKRVRVTDQLVDKGITANPSASPASKLKRPTPKTDISETKLIKPITETKSKSIKTTEKQVNESDLKMGDRNTNNDSSISEISGKSLLSHNMSKAEAIRQFGLSRKIKSKEIEDQPSSMDELSEVQPVVVLSESSSLAKPGDTQSKSFSKQLSEVRSNTDDEKSSSKRHVNTKLKEDAEKSSNPIPMSCVSNKTSLTDAEYSDLIASSDEDELSDDD